MASVSSLDQDMRRLRMDRYSPQAAAEAKAWIEHTLGQRLPHNDLIDSLKDGTVLCSLANLILPPPGIRFKPSSMPFTQRENISHFLTACEQAPISLPAHDRFLTVDLYEDKDPAQVVQCIAAFSRSANAINPAKVPTCIGPKKGSVSPTRKTAPTGISSLTTTTVVRSRGLSNVSSNGEYGPKSPPIVTSWSTKEDQESTAPAWNIHMYGYMGGASQGKQGISFGARRQIAAPQPQVTTLGEKEKRRRELEDALVMQRETEAELARDKRGADEARRKQELERERAAAEVWRAQEEQERREAEEKVVREEQERREAGERKAREAEERLRAEREAAERAIREEEERRLAEERRRQQEEEDRIEEERRLKEAIALREAEERKLKEAIARREAEERREREEQELRAAEEERKAIEAEKLRWEEETRQEQEKERLELDEMRLVMEVENARLQAEQARNERRKSEELAKDATNVIPQKIPEWKKVDKSALKGQFLSQYQAEQRANPGLLGVDNLAGTGLGAVLTPSPKSSDSERIRVLERQLEEARDRERQFELERQQRRNQDISSDQALAGSSYRRPAGISNSQSSTTAQTTNPEAAAQPDADDWDTRQTGSATAARQQASTPTFLQSTRPLPTPGSPAVKTPINRPSPFARSGKLPTTPGATSEPPSALPSRPVDARAEAVDASGTRTERFLANNPAPVEQKPASHFPAEMGMTSTSERAAEDARRVASQTGTKAGGWASKSLLEREMERERERQKEWETAQLEKSRATFGNSKGLIGPRDPPRR